MIIRYVVSNEENPFAFQVGFYHCPPDKYQGKKKWLRKFFKDSDPDCDVQFKIFFEESDYDDV